MKSFELLCPFGDENKIIMVIDNYMGGGSYQILIDKYYQGDIIKKGDSWKGHLNQRSVLTTEDIQILGSFIDEN